MKTVMVVSKLTTTKASGGKKADWSKDAVPAKDTETGLIPEDVYQVPCVGDSGAIAHHFVQHYEQPESVKDITGNFKADEHLRIFNIGLRKVNHQEGTDALKIRFEDPEARAKRLDKLREKADVAVNEWLNVYRKEHGWPSEEVYDAKLEEINKELGIPLDEV
ncbi:MAG: hypothetical protein ACXABY_18010 [Candidatus Thorarchaeota archaeon]|jgi:hypothetical protein